MGRVLHNKKRSRSFLSLAPETRIVEDARVKALGHNVSVAKRLEEVALRRAEQEATKAAKTFQLEQRRLGRVHAKQVATAKQAAQKQRQWMRQRSQWCVQKHLTMADLMQDP